MKSITNAIRAVGLLSPVNTSRKYSFSPNILSLNGTTDYLKNLNINNYIKSPIYSAIDKPPLYKRYTPPHKKYISNSYEPMAGAIIRDLSDDTIACVRGRDWDKFSLPKGKMNKYDKKSFKKCALRETKEESGYIIDQYIHEAKMIYIMHNHKKKLRVVVKSIHDDPYYENIRLPTDHILPNSNINKLYYYIEVKNKSEIPKIEIMDTNEIMYVSWININSIKQNPSVDEYNSDIRLLIREKFF